MTTDTTPAPDLVAQSATLARAAATRVVDVLPSVHPLTVAEPQAGHGQVAVGFATAVAADLVGRSGRIAVLLSPELLGEMASGPVPGQSLADVVQPAVDAAAQALGVTTGSCAEVDPAGLIEGFGPDFVVVPLVGTGGTAAVVVDGFWGSAEPAGGTVDEPVTAFEPNQADPQATIHQVVAAATPPAPTTSAAAGALGPLGAGHRPASPMRGIELLAGVDMELTVELGRTRLPVRDLLALAPGDVLELDRAAGSPADLLVNGRLIARGEVVVVDEDFGLRITEILETNAS